MNFAPINMARRQHDYTYPEVHPPHAHTPYRSEVRQAGHGQDSRYSWVNTPSEELNLSGARNADRQTTAPPLPFVPEHLDHQHVHQQHAIPERTEQPHQPSLHQIPQQLYQQHNFHQSHRPHEQIPKQQQAVMHQQTYHPPQKAESRHQTPQPQTETAQHQASQEQDPVKQVPDHPNYRSVIAPDENPLSPTSPVPRQGQFGQSTTNIPIVPPTPSNYTFNTYAAAPQPATGGTWTHSLCSCSEPTICMTGLFCPCILYGRTQHRLSLKSDKKDPTNMLGYNRVNGSCVAWALLCGINGIFSGIQKTRVRRAYEMGSGSGNVFSDCLSGCCCCCCVLAQNEKEIKHREEKVSRDGAGRQEGYVPPSGMTFAPPPR